MKNSRRKTRVVKIGNVFIGAPHPVTIQSMTNTDIRNVKATLTQIKELYNLGCQIVRVALPDIESAKAVKNIIAQSPVPIIGDIHFDYKIALESIKSGIHAIRINPGNIGSEEKVKAIAEAAGIAGISIRVGANTGSLAKEFQFKKEKSKDKYDKAEKRAEALVKSALKQCEILERYSFKNIKVSLKASDVLTTFLAYKKFATLTDYPLHLGVTEAGTYFRSSIKSSIGIGSLLMLGIGDTIRVSVTGSPLEEIKIAQTILEAVGQREAAPEIISCPTCARTTVDIIGLVNKIETYIEKLKLKGFKFKPFTLAIMGCAVNGPGEAKEADIGIAGANGKFVLFKKGEILPGFFTEEKIYVILELEIEKYRLRDGRSPKGAATIS